MKKEPKLKRIMRKYIYKRLNLLEDGRWNYEKTWWNEHPKWFKQILREIIK